MMYHYIPSSRQPKDPANSMKHLWERDLPHLSLALSYGAINGSLKSSYCCKSLSLLQQRAWTRTLNYVTNQRMADSLFPPFTSRVDACSHSMCNTHNSYSYIHTGNMRSLIVPGFRVLGRRVKLCHSFSL